MSSDVDTTFPADDVKVSKSEMRAQFLVIKNEIETLQRQSNLPWKIAVGDVSL
jgi:hypothetical protein